MKTKPLALLTLALLPSFFTPANADLKDGLVAHWSFDDCRATDNSGNGHDGTLGGNPQCVDGVKGKAFSFDGNGSTITVPSTQDLKISKTITISALVLLDQDDSKGVIFVQKGQSGVIWDYGLGSYYSYPSYRSWDADWYSDNVKTLSSNYGHYHLMTTIVDENNLTNPITTYLDGSKIEGNILGNQSISSPSHGFINQSDYPLVIGIGHPSQNLKGSIDDLRIYNRALTEAEVMELYNGGGVETGIVDLSVAITKPAAVSANKKATYKLTITNNSEFTATGVKAYFVVPGKTLVTVDVPKNCTASGRIIECSLPDLEAKKNATQSFSMKIFKKGALNVGAGVSANEDDTNEDNNEKSAVILVK